MHLMLEFSTDTILRLSRSPQVAHLSLFSPLSLSPHSLSLSSSLTFHLVTEIVKFHVYIWSTSANLIGDLPSRGYNLAFLQNEIFHGKNTDDYNKLRNYRMRTENRRVCDVDVYL